MKFILATIRFTFTALLYLLSFLPGCKNLSGFRAKRAILRAKRRKKSGLQVRAKANVLRVLPDDTVGSRHQRFLVDLHNGNSLLIAHNIDLAPRIPKLSVGDTVEFFGEYEYNERGGVIHWTHHDPRKWHVDGWLKHKRKKYT